MNTQEFINKSRLVHGDTYDYSLVRYVNNKTPVDIICSTHGIFQQTPNMHSSKRKQGCPYCGGTKRMTLDEFVVKARNKYGDKYDYSAVQYKNNKTKIEVRCKKHGTFTTTPNAHLRRQGGCPKCCIESRRGVVFGVGVYDIDFPMNSNSFIRGAYSHWHGMLSRCYSPVTQSKQKTYVGCSVKKDWWNFSTFYEWYKNNYREGYCLDKDILVSGNKVYSSSTCCFVPNEINMEFSAKSKPRNLPLGVTKTKYGKYVARINTPNGQIHIGTYDSPTDAFYAYKFAKETRIKNLANEWRGRIDERVYEAMMNFSVVDNYGIIKD